MATQIIKLNIFISGTSETDAEKSALKTIADELSGMLEKTNNLSLGVIGWPDTFRPGVNDDLQKEINRQVEGQYDIYIGLLGSRFGTPTPRAGSGTEEEFNVAINQFLKDTSSLRVLFYFKKETQDLFSINTKQLEKVKEFRSKLPDIGVLYRDFKDTAQFVDIVKDHLFNLIVEEWDKTSWKHVELSTTLKPQEEGLDKLEGTLSSSSDDTNQKTVEVDKSEDNDAGYFEIIEEFYLATNTLTKTFERLVKINEFITEKMNVHTIAANEHSQKQAQAERIGGSRKMQEYITKAKKIIDDSANDLEIYARDMKPELISLKTNMGIILSTFENAYKFAVEELKMPATKQQDDIKGLKGMIDTMVTIQDQTSSFQSTLESLPALTGKFKKARKSATSVLGELVAELRIATDRGISILHELEEIPKSSKDV